MGVHSLLPLGNGIQVFKEKVPMLETEVLLDVLWLYGGNIIIFNGITSFKLYEGIGLCGPRKTGGCELIDMSS